MPKNRKELNKQIEDVRKKYGKPPLSDQKTYEERLKEYEKREPIKR